MEDEKIKVYVKTDELNIITDINSSIFLDNTENWILIDEGFGDKYAHAQGNYFDKPLTNENGIYQFKLLDGQAIERTAEEIAEDFEKIPPAQPSEVEVLNSKIEALTIENEFLSDCLIEMAQVVYA